MINLCTIKMGSNLYGTNTPSSDLDLASVHLPDVKSILLCKVPLEIDMGIKAKKGYAIKNQPGDIDNKSIVLHQFIKLLVEGQTNPIDMLFAPKEMHMVEPHPIWYYIIENREKFIDKSVLHKFLGYCRKQASRYGVRGDRVSMVEKTIKFFTRLIELYGYDSKLVEAKNEIEAFVHTYSNDIKYSEFCKLTDIINGSGTVIRHIDICDRKVPFTNRLKDALLLYTKVYEEYGERARIAKTNEGFDGKALSHAVRIAEELHELLTTGNITLPRPNAAYLLSIKRAEVDFTSIGERLDSLDLAITEAIPKSVLREKVDTDFVEKFICDTYRNIIYREKAIEESI